jgi:hypothetical protein
MSMPGDVDFGEGSIRSAGLGLDKAASFQARGAMQPGRLSARATTEVQPPSTNVIGLRRRRLNLPPFRTKKVYHDAVPWVDAAGRRRQSVLVSTSGRRVAERFVQVDLLSEMSTFGYAVAACNRLNVLLRLR